ncbi:MAG TPA: hypothetical protein VN920_16450 [Pyrinomonadaceae bacterium]|nr:hypothetical protein [Pyrinomonadaceae bacterium]
MKKLKVILTSLCLAVAMTLVIPTAALADDGTGPQGGKKSTTPAPPPPPPTTWAQILAALAGLGIF